MSQETVWLIMQSLKHAFVGRIKRHCSELGVNVTEDCIVKTLVISPFEIIDVPEVYGFDCALKHSKQTFGAGLFRVIDRVVDT
jgi:hypothetical protein